MIMNLEEYDESRKIEIYVLDTETTGLKGAPDDVVVDIGICKVNLNEETVEDAYSKVVGHDVNSWNSYRKTAWIFENTDMTLDMVANGTPFLKVKEEVKTLLYGKNVTTYNMQYDMDKFLYREPWALRDRFVPCKDIMVAATNVCKIPSPYYPGSYKYPKLDYAYEFILKGKDPAGINGKQDHRALSDARMASHIMIEMFREGTYSP